MTRIYLGFLKFADLADPNHDPNPELGPSQRFWTNFAQKFLVQIFYYLSVFYDFFLVENRCNTGL